jgi:hypothetical protein
LEVRGKKWQEAGESYMIRNFSKYCLDDSIKEDVIGETSQWRDETCT